MLIVTSSKPRSRYILLRVTSSGNSCTQGTHQVAHKLIRRNFLPLFLTSPAAPAISSVSRLTGSLAQVTAALCIQLLFSIHLIEQPKVLVTATGTSRLSSRASIAL